VAFRRVAASLLLGALFAGCVVRPCRENTLFLTLGFDGAAGQADTVRIALSLSGGGMQTFTAQRAPGSDTETVEIDFQPAYPTGETLTAQIEALAANVPIAGAQGSVPIAPTCTAFSMTVTAFAASDGGALDSSVADLATVADAAPPDASPPATHRLADVGSATASGAAQQHKIVWAHHDQSFWLFHFDDNDSGHLAIRSSKDFVTWIDQPPLALPVKHDGDGRNFSVIALERQMNDVVHGVLSLHDGSTRQVFHLRGVISAGAIAFDPIAMVTQLTNNPTGCDPDGPSVAVAIDGHIADVTGWFTTNNGNDYCDFNVYRSADFDDGGLWNNAFTLSTHTPVNGLSNAHMLVNVSGQDLLGGWDQPSGMNSYTVWSVSSGGSWPGPQDLFPKTETSAFNDWSLCSLSPTNIVAVRRRVEGGNMVFDDYVWNGINWMSGNPLASEAGLPGSGVALLSDGARVAAFTIGADANQSVRYAVRDEAGTWSAWATFAGTKATRAYISGSGCEENQHPVVLWTESSNVGLGIVGAADPF
jgi:hypothetical protein